MVQNRPQLEADLEALLQRGLALRQRHEYTKRLLEPGPGILERRPSGRLESGLPQIVHRLLPQLAAEGVMGEPLDVLDEAIRVKRLDRAGDPRVQIAAPLSQEAAIGYVMRKSVLESVFELREETYFIKKLSCLEMCDATAQVIRG